ncbi:hypothetical protein L1049_016526 [Liquidambar formosana]|uniref:Uncharacterized protein n=1 Tax=Liquidambar formosana TaxID=63359 RepID=A0AAP0S6J0_LIQFO
MAKFFAVCENFMFNLNFKPELKFLLFYGSQVPNTYLPFYFIFFNHVSLFLTEQCYANGSSSRNEFPYFSPFQFQNKNDHDVCAFWTSITMMIHKCHHPFCPCKNQVSTKEILLLITQHFLHEHHLRLIMIMTRSNYRNPLILYFTSSVTSKDSGQFDVVIRKPKGDKVL